MTCVKNVSHTKVKVEEKGKKAIFVNTGTEEFKVVSVDGCVIPKGETASDYLVVKNKTASVFVELKGKDVNHACDQLFSTKEDPRVQKFIEGKVGFLVVCSKYPRFDTYVARAKQKAAKTYNAGFHVVCNKGEFDIERCAAIDGPR